MLMIVLTFIVGIAQLEIPVPGTQPAASGDGINLGVVPVGQRKRQATCLREPRRMPLFVGGEISFFAHESCGQCVPCRVGMQR
ncbi:MAG TPA: hypothetical protein ENH11_03355 [Candidatus Acetothermia bacterium]|nr:hypothetical protein [Candidatus Acetothermia bacterium]